jgi:hypothetical protein
VTSLLLRCTKEVDEDLRNMHDAVCSISDVAAQQQETLFKGMTNGQG